jgi:hypothetical protein
MDVDDSAEPGMPLIKHLYSFGHMGFVPLACTIMSGYTRFSVTAPRARSSRTFAARLVLARGKMASRSGRQGGTTRRKHEQDFTLRIPDRGLNDRVHLNGPFPS